MMDKFELNILGCGSASPGRHLPTSQVLNVRDNLFMIDCGESAQLSMARQRLKYSRLKHIFISHLHGDHCLGLPGLLTTLAMHECTGGVTVHISAEGARIFDEFLRFFLKDSDFNVEFEVFGNCKSVIYEDDAIVVTTLPLKHRVPTMGFLFEEKPKLRHINGEMVRFHNVPMHMYNNLRQGKDYITPEGNTIPNNVLTTAADPSISYAYCSDTAYSARLIKMLHEPTWIYHEATYTDDSAKLAKQRGHSTGRQAATVARMVGAENLILGHFSKRYQDEQPFADEAREEFSGRIVLANEGMKIDLTR
ncbi:MAG: ribonuclease Z [Muribaculaceae bacterium]